MFGKKNRQHPEKQHKITEIRDVCPPKIMVHRKYCPFFIRLKRRLKEPEAFMIQHIIHEYPSVKIFLSVQNRHLAFEGRIAFLTAGIFRGYKIVQPDIERQGVNFTSVE